MTSDLKTSQILIVDDNPVNIKVMYNTLKSAGYAISVAQNGASAIHIAAHSLPDLILLDIMMPEMDGFQVCEKLKSNPVTQNIPIIFITARSEAPDITKAFDLGCVDFISKPFRQEELLLRARNHLRIQSLAKHNEKLIEELKETSKNLEAMTRQKVKAESEKRLSSIVNYMVDAVITIDASGDIKSFNPAAERIFGYSTAEVLGKNVKRLMPEPYKSEHDGYMQNYLNTGKAKIIGIGREVVGRRKNGSTFPMLLGVSEIEIEGQRIFTGIIHDITDRKLMETALRSSETRLRAILSSAAESIITINEEGVIQSFNPAAEKLFGYADYESVGKNVSILMPDPHQKNHDSYIQNYLNTGNAKIIGIGAEVVGMRKDGTTFPMELSISKTMIEGQMFFTGFVRNITDRKLAEEEIKRAHSRLQASLEKVEEANSRLQELDTQKSRFISSINHELRTPLNAVLGFSDLLQNEYFGPLNEKQKSYVSQIIKGGKHLLELISDLLDISKIDAGAVVLQMHELEVKECVMDILDMLHSQTHSKNLNITIQLDPSIETITADKRRLNQIFLNLLSNAIKYTPENGQIEIKSAQENDFIKFFVYDTGVGITEKDKTKIFSEFYQVNRERDEAMGGTGIGLALTRRLVVLHGGDIGVESELDKGSCFWFTLPLNKMAGEKKRPPASTPIDKSLTGRHILIVEDNDDNLALTLDMISVQNHKVSVARNGKEAIEVALSEQPELILMDIRMPVMSGLEAAQELRKLSETSRIPIIAMTASEGENSRDKCLEAGFSGHITKPIDAEALFGILTRFLK